MRNLPLIFCWGVWIARNKSLFQDKETPASVTEINNVAIYSTIPLPETKKYHPPQRQVIIQEGLPWAYFDGASQNNRAGEGMCIHLKSDHLLKASVGLGSGSNNYAELSALRLLLCWLLHRNILSIQIFGDSVNVINWANGSSICQNQILKTILEEILQLKTSFNSLILCHVYRDQNEEADRLSKKGVQQIVGSWSIVEDSQGQISTYDLPPFVIS